MTRLLLQQPTVVCPDGSVKEADIAIEGNRIAYIGNVPADWQAEQVIPAKDKLAVPGFINAHTHASMTLLRSYADDMNLMDWLQKKIWPIEAKMREDDIYWGAMLAILEMIQSGTTAFADMYGPWMNRVAEAVIETGMRAALCQGLIGVAPDADKKLASNVALFKDYNGAADGRIKVMFGPHALYTCPPDYLRKVNKAAQSLGAEIHIHMSETRGEVENCVRQYGKRPFAHVETTGLFENGTLAAHCVYLDEEDIFLIRKYRIRIAHNPGSNMKLASGTAPIPRLLQDNICVALGTDGTSSNNNLDMLEEVRLAALLHKVTTHDPLAIPAWEALKMGTVYGARALGYEDVGELAVEQKADIVLWSMHDATWRPHHEPISLLVYAANSSSVDTVLVDGRILMQNRQLLTLDEEKVLYEAEKRGMELAQRARP